MKKRKDGFLILALFAMLMVLLCLLLSSCSDARRMQRIENRHPSWVTSDTITKYDTTVINSIKADTSFIWRSATDTVLITKDRLRVQIIHDHDSIRVAAECKGDTIIKEIPILIKTLNPPVPLSWWQCLFMWFGGMMIVAAIIGLIIFLLTGVKPRLKL